MLRKPSVQLGLIVVGTVVAIAITLILGYQSQVSTEKTILKEFNERKLAEADSTANGTEQYLETLASVMRPLADTVSLLPDGEPIDPRLLKHAFIDIEPFGAKEIDLTDPDGKILDSTPDSSTIGQHFPHKNIFEDAVKTKVVHSLLVEYGLLKEGKDEKGLILAIPIRRHLLKTTEDDEFLGIIDIDLGLKYLDDTFIDTVQPTVNGFPILITEDYTILSSPEDKDVGENILDKAKGFSRLENILKNMSSGKRESQSFKYYEFDKKDKIFKDNVIEYLISYSPVSAGARTWSVGILSPLSDAKALAQKALNRLIAIVGAVIIIVLISSTVAFISVNRATKEIKKNESTYRRIATILQNSFKRTTPDIPGLDIWIRYKAAYEAEQVGGDFYDIFQIDEDKILVLIGDVAGKGVEAAGFTETIRSSIRSVCSASSSPANILEQVNNVFVPQIAGEGYVTVTLALLYKNQGKAIVANGGHPPLIHLADKSSYVKVVHGLPLGVMKGQKYKEVEINLSKGEGLLMFTDGLNEARSETRKFYGFDRIIETIGEATQKTSREIVDGLLDSASSFANEKINDDIAILAVKLEDEDDGVV